MTNLAFDTTSASPPRIIAGKNALRPNADLQSRSPYGEPGRPGSTIIRLPDVNVEAQEEHLQARDAARVPHITIQVFCVSPDVEAAVERAGKDRLMSRARMMVQTGGIPAAITYFKDVPTPNLIVLESCSADDGFLTQLDALAEICDVGTKVMVIGHVNDIAFYRALVGRGVSEYIVAPADPVAFINAVSGIYQEASAGKIGQICAFIGAKGGVGSSTVAHNVGWTMAQRFGSDVVLADLDLAFGTASLGFDLEAGQGIAEAIQDASRLDEVLLDRLVTKYGDHLRLLAAPASLDKVYDLDELVLDPLLDVAQSSVPFVVLDLPHMWTSWTRSVLMSADEIVITATPDLANLRNAKNLVEFLKHARPNDPPPKVILNQVGAPKRPEIKPKDFAKALQIEPMACIPYDPQVFGTAANNGQMIAEIAAKSAASKSLSGVAEMIVGRKDLKRRRAPFAIGSFFERMKRMSR